MDNHVTEDMRDQFREEAKSLMNLAEKMEATEKLLEELEAEKKKMEIMEAVKKLVVSKNQRFL